MRVGIHCFTTYLKSVIGCVNGALSVPSAMEVRWVLFSKTNFLRDEKCFVSYFDQSKPNLWNWSSCGIKSNLFPGLSRSR